MSLKGNKNGFTLIELMIAMAIASIIMTAVYAMFEAQVRGHISQEVSLDMQQGTRAVLEIMEKEIRMAGCDPTQEADAEITVANVAELSFNMDIEDDAGTPQSDGDILDSNEFVRYALTNDADRDGIADGTPCDLGRDTGAGLQPFARNIDALNFVYLDGEGNVTADTEEIRTIQLSLVARGGAQLRGLIRPYTDNTVYRNQQATTILPAPGDNFRRLFFTTTIYCRNIR